MAMNLVHETQSNTQDRPTAHSVAMLFLFEMFSARHHLYYAERAIMLSPAPVRQSVRLSVITGGSVKNG